MSKIIKSALIVAALVPSLALAQGNTVITKDLLVEMFDNMAKDTPWDLSRPVLWGYFFTDPSRQALERAAPLLECQGYRIVDIYLSDKDEPSESDLWWLHVEKVEVHTPDTLDQRNQVLHQFAHDEGIDTYDGMDVGPATESTESPPNNSFNPMPLRGTG